MDVCDGAKTLWQALKQPCGYQLANARAKRAGVDVFAHMHLLPPGAHPAHGEVCHAVLVGNADDLEHGLRLLGYLSEAKGVAGGGAGVAARVWRGRDGGLWLRSDRA